MKKLNFVNLILIVVDITNIESLPIYQKMFDDFNLKNNSAIIITFNDFKDEK
jgi:hypothetical protein